MFIFDGQINFAFWAHTKIDNANVSRAENQSKFQRKPKRKTNYLKKQTRNLATAHRT